MKKAVLKLLMWLSKMIFRKNYPTNVAGAGAVGKTATRRAITVALGKRFRVYTSPENYNNEFGVPFSIMGVEAPGRSIWSWFRIFARVLHISVILDDIYPNVLVLEYGVDHPGDMEYLCRMARPDVSVLTAISHVHVANFESFDELVAEKVDILEQTKPEGLAVLNADDDRVRTLAPRAAALIRTYGLMATADIRAENVKLFTREDFSFDPGEKFCEMRFDIVLDDARVPAKLVNMLGIGQVSAALAAVAVGLQLNVPLSELVAQLPDILPQPGRMHPLPGIKGALILDDTYNAAPASMRAALDVLREFSPMESARRIAVLGKMAELGPYSEEQHREIGKKAASIADMLVTVGEEARDIRRGAIEAGMTEEKMQHFNTPVEAGRFLDREIKKGDIVAVKGSQSARMEKVVKDVMAQPERSEELLVRQYGKWQKT